MEYAMWLDREVKRNKVASLGYLRRCKFFFFSLVFGLSLIRIDFSTIISWFLLLHFKFDEALQRFT